MKTWKKIALGACLGVAILTGMPGQAAKSAARHHGTVTIPVVTNVNLTGSWVLVSVYTQPTVGVIAFPGSIQQSSNALTVSSPFLGGQVAAGAVNGTAVSLTFNSSMTGVATYNGTAACDYFIYGTMADNKNNTGYWVAIRYE